MATIELSEYAEQPHRETVSQADASSSPSHEHNLSSISEKEAWTQVFASFLINMNVYGLVNGFGDFQHFYETDYFVSHSSSAISWIGTIQGALVLFTGAISGPLFDFGHFLLVLRLASLFLVVSWMLLSISTQYYQVVLTQGVLAGFCAGLMEVPSIALISDYFKRRTGLALGVAVSGAPAGGLIYSVVFRSVLGVAGFAWATRAVGFVVLGTLGIALIIVKPRDAGRKGGRRTFPKLKTFADIPTISIILVAFFIWCAVLVPYFATPAFAESLGVEKSTSTYLVAVLNGSQFFGRIIPAWRSDYSGAANMYLAAEIFMGFLSFHWITIANLGGLVEFLVLIGFTSGALASLGPIVVPHVCGKQEWMGTFLGIVYAAAGLGVLIGNPIALAALKHKERPREFLAAQLFMGACALVGAILFLIPRRQAFKNWRSSIRGGNEARDSSSWQDLKHGARLATARMWNIRKRAS